MEKPISLVFLSWFLLFLNHWSLEVHATAATNTVSPGAGVRFKLIHRHSPELGDSNGTSTFGPPSSQRERIKQLLYSDKARHQTISHRLSLRRKNAELKIMSNGRHAEAEFPLRAGAADIGSGQYYVSLRVGYPPKKYLLMADTGSDLTWIKCKYKCEDCSKGGEEISGRVYNPASSRTFKPIPCNSQTCGQLELQSFADNNNCTPTAPCPFDYRYGEATRVLGFYGNDTVKFRLQNGHKIKITDVMVGCTEKITQSRGDFREIDGIMGLGCTEHSFAVKAARIFGHKFSYCLVDHMSHGNVFNYLHFGEVTDPPPQKLQYTKLLLGMIAPFYALNVSGVSVDGKLLDIPPYIWDFHKDGGVITDCGTSLTAFPKPAYDQIVAALEPFIRKFKKVDVREGLEHCFNITGFQDSAIPQLAIHFADGTKYAPPVKNYIIYYDKGIKCIGVRALPWPSISIIGNIFQQNHFWEFDLQNGRMGFAPSSCTINE
ncbi:hypothetical protein PTKIN_Ptkin18bG0122400 [Pterospermum kingtungense]